MTEYSPMEDRETKEKLKRLLRESAIEVLPSQKAVGLLSKIPHENTVNVTCRPTGIEDTMAFVKSIEVEDRSRLCPHIAARRIRDERHFDEICTTLLENDIKRLFVVGGDGESFGQYRSALDVLVGLTERGMTFDEIGIGGYPEGNSVFDLDETEVLLMKQFWAEKTGANLFIVTQVCFETDTLLNWVKEIRSAGVYLPVRVGVLGKIGIESFSKVLGSLGVTDIVAFLKSKTELARSIALKSIGGYNPEDYIMELAQKMKPEHKLYGVNVFTLGNVSATMEEVKGMIK